MAETPTLPEDANYALRLLNEAAAGRAEAQSRGTLWPDYELVLQIAQEMEADAAERLARQADDSGSSDAVRSAENHRPQTEVLTRPPPSSTPDRATEPAGPSRIAAASFPG